MNPHDAIPLTPPCTIWHRFWSLLRLAGRGAATPPLLGTSVDESSS